MRIKVGNGWVEVPKSVADVLTAGGWEQHPSNPRLWDAWGTDAMITFGKETVLVAIADPTTGRDISTRIRLDDPGLAATLQRFGTVS